MTATTESHAAHDTGGDGRSSSYLSQLNHDDLKVVREALSKLGPSPYMVDTHERQPLICMREITSNGRSSLIETTQSQLLSLVNNAAASIDVGGHENLEGKSFSEFPAKAKKTASSRYAATLNLQHKSVAIGLLGRDLRRLDFDSHPSEEPSIRVRRHAILFSVDPIRAIIMSTRIVIIVPPGGMDQILEIVEKYMLGEEEGKLNCTNIKVTSKLMLICGSSILFCLFCIIIG